MQVPKAWMVWGVAQKLIVDFEAYRHKHKARLNPTTSVLSQVYAQVKANPKTVIFAEADNEVVLRAAVQYREFGIGDRDDDIGRVVAKLDRAGDAAVGAAVSDVARRQHGAADIRERVAGRDRKSTRLNSSH